MIPSEKTELSLMRSALYAVEPAAEQVADLSVAVVAVSEAPDPGMTVDYTQRDSQTAAVGPGPYILWVVVAAYYLQCPSAEPEMQPVAVDQRGRHTATVDHIGVRQDVRYCHLPDTNLSWRT